MTSQILGNFIAYITLSSLNEIYFFLIMGVIAFLGTLSFLLIKDPEKEIDNDLQSSLGIIDDKVENTNLVSTFKDDIKSVLNLLIYNKRMRMMLP